MSKPTIALTKTIVMGGEARTLKYGLLAYHSLGINPFDPATIKEFTSKQLDLMSMARLIRAGLLAEYYGKDATRKGQTPPEPEDLLVDMGDDFPDVAKSIFELLGDDAENKTKGDGDEPKADPPTA